ncbi:hypothetical protein [Sphingobacterium sp. SYP-B4668]|uniref:hypothetical protein n=1 Tax=Sphingobacterium sp. SYP-B4668 TaxID=2996035 RepID=UPI0022DE839F|nr:hypothetical protein [Sphingobacterium sp. SYP-B4668]
MNIKYVLTAFLGCVAALNSYAQDLIRKVPTDANIVVTFDCKRFFNLVEAQEFNATLQKLGFFDKLSKNELNGINKIEDIGLDLTGKGYVFNRKTDSINYIGALIPLSDEQKFKSLIPAHKKIQTVDGLQTIYSADRSTRMSWDQQGVYIMTGLITDVFFERDSVADHYGLQSRGLNGMYDTAVDAAEAIDSAYYDEYEEDEVIDTVEEIEILEPPIIDSISKGAEIDAPPVVVDVEDYPSIEIDGPDLDAVEVDTADDYYYQMIVHDDSIKNALVSEWVNKELSDLIATRGDKGFSAKGYSNNLKPNAIANLWVRSLEGLYNDYFPTYLVRMATGYDPQFRFGFGEISMDLIVDKNKLKIVGDMDVDKEILADYKAIYKRKINPKFLKFVDKDVVGFLSFNVNTEGYLKFMPKFTERYYASLLPNYSDIISLGTLLFDIALDEKAIAKVFSGDNLFVVNGISKQVVKYKDYEYDDDYNMTEVEKTKTETLPQFLWMFSSEDTRIFERLLKLGVKEELVINHDGVYEAKEKGGNDIKVYFLINDGIVFIGNDLVEMQDIKANRIHRQPNPAHSKMLKQNNMTMVFNANTVPTLLKDLEIPIVPSMKMTVDELGQYGDFSIVSKGIKGNKVSAEVSVEFPNTGRNALGVLLDLINRHRKDLE